MTARGEDVLAWLDRAIAERERWATVAAVSLMGVPEGGVWRQRRDEHRGGYRIFRPAPGASPESVAFVFGESEATHITLNAPDSVLRHCAADRKLLDLHGPAVLRGGSGPRYYETTKVCRSCEPPRQFPETAYPCPTIVALAEGYGWTGGEQ